MKIPLDTARPNHRQAMTTVSVLRPIMMLSSKYSLVYFFARHDLGMLARSTRFQSTERSVRKDAVSF